jgi:hypothetical protein
MDDHTLVCCHPGQVGGNNIYFHISNFGLYLTLNDYVSGGVFALAFRKGDFAAAVKAKQGSAPLASTLQTSLIASKKSRGDIFFLLFLILGFVAWCAIW